MILLYFEICSNSTILTKKNIKELEKEMYELQKKHG